MAATNVTTAALANTTTTTQFSTVTPRAVDFVSRFNKNWEDLRTIMGIIRPVPKAPGTKLVSYTASIDGGLKGGATVGEGELIPFTKAKVVENAYGDITFDKYAKAVTIEDVAKYGAEIAIEKTDDAFLAELQATVMSEAYTTLLTGTLRGSQKTWQRALAIAKGAVLNKFKALRLTATTVVGFANIMDYYEWLGDQQITVQTLNGITYIKDFMGYSVLFLLGDDEIPAGTVVATPSENLVLYYIKPSDPAFQKLGLNYTVMGETDLIGFADMGNYSRAQGESYAIMGMRLWPEYADGICIVEVKPTVDNTKPTVDNTKPTVAAAS